MGCDIHGWVEVKKGERWVACKELEDDARNYVRFNALAGVRGTGSDKSPLGIPSDVSETSQLHIDYWGIDGHSHSYMNLNKAAQIFLDTAYEPSDFDITYPLSAYFDIDRDDEEARLVFWFDN